MGYPGALRLPHNCSQLRRGQQGEQAMADLMMACTSDVSGIVRGKGFAAADLDRRIARGVGWTPTNVQITCFDTIADSPYGALGDIVLWPDPATRADLPLPGGGRLSMVLGDIRDLAGAPWECCTRGILRTALDRFRSATGLELRATFEHEFMLSGLPDGATRGFSLQGFAAGQAYLSALADALAGAGIAPDSFLREYGPDQFELTLPPQPVLRAADEAVILREAARAVARSMGQRATFSPLLAPDIVGNGVHIHFSLWDDAGNPVTEDVGRQDGLSASASAFAAGVLRHLNAVSALTAPSAISPLRMVPHRWSAAFNNLGRQDREAAIRICPVTATDPVARARQFNMEFRAADACATPYLALAAVVIAGTLGLEDGLICSKATEEDLSLLTPEALAARGYQRLPETLEGAIAALRADTTFAARFPGAFVDVYAAHKTGEAAHVAGMNDVARMAAYAAVY
jgi:glutamine synthetase